MANCYTIFSLLELVAEHVKVSSSPRGLILTSDPTVQKMKATFGRCGISGRERKITTAGELDQDNVNIEMAWFKVDLSTGLFWRQFFSLQNVTPYALVYLWIKSLSCMLVSYIMFLHQV